MRVVLQRVSRASVTVNGGPERKIGPGIMLLVGIREGDTPDLVPKMAEKCANLRIFEDEEGKMNRSAVELGYSALVVSNFTLYANTRKGKRPSFVAAAAPVPANELYELFLKELANYQLADIQHGEFGADMQIDMINDGPVTIILDTEEWKK